MKPVSEKMRAHLERIRPKSLDAAARLKLSQYKAKPSRSASPLIRDLFAALDASSLTQNEVAKRSRVTGKTLTSWRHGVTTPKITDLESVAGVLSLTITIVPARSS